MKQDEVGKERARVVPESGCKKKGASRAQRPRKSCWARQPHRGGRGASGILLVSRGLRDSSFHSATLV